MKKEGYLYCSNFDCQELISEIPLNSIIKEGQDKVVLTCPKCGTTYEISNVEYEYDM